MSHIFARSQNNNDEHIYQYFHTNISEKEMYRYNRIDNLKHDTPVISTIEKEIAEYYPENPTLSHHFKDLVLTEENGRANVLVYIGATGSFLDNITRGGFPKIISGFKRDFTSISATLKEIQSSNRHDETNTEVYLVGIPRYIGTPVTDILINRHLKEIAKNYANVTYVEPIKAKLFYGLKADAHKIAIMHEVAQKKLSEYLDPIIDKYLSMMKAENKDTQKFLEDIKTYINERLPYDFYYLGKDNLNKFITR